MTGWVIQLLVAAMLAAPGASSVASEVVPTPEVVIVASPEPRPQPIVLTVNRADIEAWIEQYASQYGVAAETLRYMARCESAFNPRAVNGPYAGIYQYSAGSWSSNRKVMGEDPNPQLRFDAQEAIKTTAFIVSTRGGGMWPNCMP